MTAGWRKIETPISDGVIGSLKAGDRVLLSGTIYTARDRAHERLVAMAERQEALPLDLSGQVIYYMGPSPAPPGRVIGSAGPTTSSRMDPFTGAMLGLGVRGMIGKGKRDASLRDLCARYRAVYFATFGGAGAYLALRVRESELIAFEDLGTEAIYRLRVEDFPLIVVNDIYGSDLYEDVVGTRG
ncbi:MAG TPA: FumA C-terminus/TtdB family hydratase beta subunit [Spirochaetota bacterium]|nr:fumarate hydratase C-terminal domain-containing protein [Spirochaetota bacterium]HOD13257.1 FumA C-terminus/TtdB family hydratase beta subunit [Spirochaetota bacterium]HPG48935.1 FumA C-terminus/TtdB family hydratase beta subunit [Spirochaetota bacterium]HPN10845.1 FumA C-terminus/TtdB family hydratase beta subunit [Spirochaetota bacterium]HQL82704.1 FumA C-terminus/TtdB family hydratase beta subunit [Spirochaetota bacterium]